MCHSYHYIIIFFGMSDNNYYTHCFFIAIVITSNLFCHYSGNQSIGKLPWGTSRVFHTSLPSLFMFFYYHRLCDFIMKINDQQSKRSFVITFS